MPTKIMVLGGAGYIGSTIVQKLIDFKFKKEEIIVVDNLLYDRDYLDNRVTFEYCDITQWKLFKHLINKYAPNIVFHFAGIVGDEACRIHSKYSHSVNVGSVKTLSDYFDGRIIFPSSCSVYGASEELLNEKSALNPLSLYASQKIEAEETLKNRKNTLILRLGTVHGVSPNRFRNDLVVHTLTLRAIKHGVMNVYGGKQFRPLIHIDDLVTIATSKMYSDISGIFNISFDNYLIIEIANRIAELTVSKVIEQEIPFEDFRNYRVSNELAKKELRFKPKLDIEKTVRDICEYRENGRIKDFSNIDYCNLGRMKFDI